MIRVCPCSSSGLDAVLVNPSAATRTYIARIHRSRRDSVGWHRLGRINQNLLGIGGMGEVYSPMTQAWSRLALKILPEAFRSDAARLARFEREARALAALNHPNIATIHGWRTSGIHS